MDEPLLYPIKQMYPDGLEAPFNMIQYMIQRYFRRLYEESLSEPEYALLCLQDYLRLLDEAVQWLCPYDRDAPWIKLANIATGRYVLVSTLPDLPRCKEFSRAHLVFAHWQHAKLPELKSGEIIVLCPSSAEKYLDRKYGSKP